MALAKPEPALWQRYFQAGEQYYQKHDEEKAKRYWLQAFAEISKTGRQAGNQRSYLQLRERIIGLYPKPDPNAPVSSENVQKLSARVSALAQLSKLETPRTSTARGRIYQIDTYDYQLDSKELAKKQELLKQQQAAASTPAK
ncbi:MAG TPA: hypothetical protein V6C81_10625 [Planktothrix sp.]|jgi:hypothetical protein